jgi:hypothetical protein
MSESQILLSNLFLLSGSMKDTAVTNLRDRIDPSHPIFVQPNR